MTEAYAFDSIHETVLNVLAEATIKFNDVQISPPVLTYIKGADGKAKEVGALHFTVLGLDPAVANRLASHALNKHTVLLTIQLTQLDFGVNGRQEHLDEGSEPADKPKLSDAAQAVAQSKKRSRRDAKPEGSTEGKPSEKVF